MILLLIQIALIIYYNLTDLTLSLDHDAANTIYHYDQVILNGTLDLPDWNDTTSLELDSSMLFAVPITYLTIYLLVINRLTAHAGLTRSFRLAAMLLVITPWAFGMLDYFNMMFFNASQYTVRVLTPLLLILVMQYLWMPARSKAQQVLLILLLIAWSAFFLITTMSMGFYTFLCGILPVFFGILISITRHWENRRRRELRSSTLMLVLAICIFVLGMFLHNQYYHEVSRTTMALTTAANWESNLLQSIKGIFQLFGSIPTQSVPAASLEGILLIIKNLFIVFILLISAAYTVLHLLSHQTRNEGKNSQPANPAAASVDLFPIRPVLLSLFAANLLIVILIDTRYTGNTSIEYRYLLIGAVPLLILAVILCSDYLKSEQIASRNLLASALMLTLVGIVVWNNSNVFQNRGCSRNEASIVQKIQKLDVDSVIFDGYEDIANTCRALDLDHRYGVLDPDSNQLIVSKCSYNESGNPDYFTGRCALVTAKGVLPPDNMQPYYTLQGTAWDFDVYVSDYSHLQ